MYGALCCDGSVTFEERQRAKHIGDPTETSIILAAHQKRDAQGRSGPTPFPRLAELPFDSDRKLHDQRSTESKGRMWSSSKGAFDMHGAPVHCRRPGRRSAEINDQMS